MPRGRLCLAAAAALLLVAGPANAQTPDARTEPAFLDWYNRKIHGFNEWAVARFGSPSTWTVDGLIPTAVGSAFASALANVVNEPVTAIAGVVAGDHARVGNAAQRFAVNTTVGLAGTRDVAAEHGQPADYLDLGLALCARGVPEGPFIMVPLVGPRTLRDGFADGFLTSVLFFYLPYLAFGDAPAIAAWSLIGMGQVVAETVTFRQMDPEAIALHGGDYEALRAAYIAQRSARCDRYRSTMNGARDAP